MKNIKGVAVTAIFFTIAVIMALVIYRLEGTLLWTRDGRVRADVVTLAGEVEGKVTSLNVHDNQQVNKGALLFIIDPQNYETEVAVQRAKLASAKSRMAQLGQMAERRRFLANQAISREEVTNSGLSYQQAKEDVNAIEQQLRQATINLERTRVYAPVAGYVTNLLIQRGDYIKVGNPVLSLVDRHSFYVYGYFQEDVISRIHPGARAVVKLLDRGIKITGRVDSISRGVVDDSNKGREGTLHDVNPTFEWVRLPIRIPVRIHLDDDAIKKVTLVSGMTCSVSIE